eukprot:m.131094 g.131094  ORF g.131094 m.131094 type:complete len:1583 (-) comp13067_c0_seq4:192-4940(-)
MNGKDDDEESITINGADDKNGQDAFKRVRKRSSHDATVVVVNGAYSQSSSNSIIPSSTTPSQSMMNSSDRSVNRGYFRGDGDGDDDGDDDHESISHVATDTTLKALNSATGMGLFRNSYSSSLNLKTSRALQELFACVEEGRLRDFPVLLKDVELSMTNRQGTSVLHLAASQGHRGITLRLLLGDRLHYNLRDKDDKTPMQYANNNGFTDMVTLFQKLPLSVLSLRQPHQKQGNTPFEFYFKAPKTQLRLSAMSASDRLLVQQNQPLRKRAVSTPVKKTAQPLHSDYAIISNQLERLNIWDAKDMVGLRDKFQTFHRIQANTGDVIFREGDSSNTGVYIGISGRFHIYKKDASGTHEVIIGSFSAPCMFGDLGVIFQTARHYTIKSSRNGVMVRIPAVALDEMVNSTQQFISGSIAGSDRSSSVASDEMHGPRSKRSSISSDRSGVSSKKSGTSSSTAKYIRGRNRSFTVNGVQDKKRNRNRSNSNNSHGNFNMRHHKPHWPSRLFKPFKFSRGKGGGSTRSAVRSAPSTGEDDSEDAISGTEESFLPTAPDHAVRSQKDGRHLVVASTSDALLKLVLNNTFIDDDLLVADFFCTFRRFMKVEDVLKGIALLFNQGEEQRASALLLLANWSALAPNHTDPHFPLDEQLHAKIKELLAQWEGDDSVTSNPNYALTLFNIEKSVSAYHAATQPEESIIPQHGKINVEVVLDSKNIITGAIPVSNDSSLEELRQIACNLLFPQAKEQESLSKDLFPCRAPFFGVDLMDSVKVLSCGLTTITLRSTRSQYTDHFSWFDPEAIAELLTMVDFHSFAKLDLYFLIEYATKKQKDHDLLPTMKELTHRFNKISDWVATVVLSLPNPQQRARMLELLIETADRFYELYNFHGVLQILSALRTAAIKRLKKSWAQVTEGKKAILNTMHGIISPDDNRNAYRRKLASIGKQFYSQSFGSVSRKQCVSPCLPYIGFALSDIVYFFDGNKKESLKSYRARGMPKPETPEDEQELINLYRYRGVNHIIEDIRVYQRTPYTTAQLTHATPANAAYTKWFFDNFEGLDMDKAWEKSLEVEPALHKGSSKPQSSRPSSTTSEIDNTEAFDQDMAFSSNSIFFLGTFPVGRFEKMSTMSHIARTHAHEHGRRGHRVQGAIEDSNVVFKGVKSADENLKIPIKSIIFYNLDPEEKLMFIITSGTSQQMHLFHADFAATEQIYNDIHRAVQQRNKGGKSATLRAHEDEHDRLLMRSVPDGTFVLRDSTTRRGDFSLAIKNDGEVLRMLVESVDGGVAFKDSPMVFSTLQELIAHHSVHQCELPVLLQPGHSDFRTASCKLITGFDLASVDSDHEEITTRTSHITAPWFFLNTSRQEAESILLQNGPIVGMFLVRESSIGMKTYALSFVTSKKDIIHVAVSQNDHYFCLDGTPCAESLSEIRFVCMYVVFYDVAYFHGRFFFCFFFLFQQIIRICSRPDQPWLETPLKSFPPRVGRRARQQMPSQQQHQQQHQQQRTLHSFPLQQTQSLLKPSSSSLAPPSTSLLRTALNQSIGNSIPGDATPHVASRRDSEMTTTSIHSSHSNSQAPHRNSSSLVFMSTSI